MNRTLGRMFFIIHETTIQGTYLKHHASGTDFTDKSQIWIHWVLLGGGNLPLFKWFCLFLPSPELMNKHSSASKTHAQLPLVGSHRPAVANWWPVRLERWATSAIDCFCHCSVLERIGAVSYSMSLVCSILNLSWPYQPGHCYRLCLEASRGQALPSHSFTQFTFSEAIETVLPGLQIGNIKNYQS